MSSSSISVQSLVQRGGDRDLLIDVRTPAEFEACHPEGAVNVPLDRLDPAEVLKQFPMNSDGKLYLTCQSGTRAKMAQEKFNQAGIPNAVLVEGGLNAWRMAGFPVVEGKATISVDRQARIVIGSIVVLGVVIGFAVHPIGFALSGLVGAGLVYAGVTDTCAIAMLLARMPWNQGSCSANIRSCSA